VTRQLSLSYITHVGISVRRAPVDDKYSGVPEYSGLICVSEGKLILLIILDYPSRLRR
jgi:hypothetical protein